MERHQHEVAQEYFKTDIEAKINAASPYELINMLFEGAKKNINIAKVYINEGNQHQYIAKKGEHLCKSLDIVIELQRSLNLDKGGEIASNLNQLYDYIQSLLFEANVNNNLDKLDEAYRLLDTVHQGWQGIKDEVERF